MKMTEASNTPAARDVVDEVGGGCDDDRTHGDNASEDVHVANHGDETIVYEDEQFP